LAVIEIAECANEAEKQLSLDVYNAVWPHDAVTMDEVSVYEAGALGYADLLARLDGRVVGSAHGALTPQRPAEVRVLLTVLDDARGRGVGSALYARISDWAREHGIERLEATVADDDHESLAFAQRRGFVEHKREGGLVLDLTRTEPVAVEPPPGVELVLWDERPGRARGIYDVQLEAWPDIPGSEDRLAEPFDSWLARDSGAARHTFVAVAGDEVVGFAKLAPARARPKVADNHLTAVTRAWRRRGVARALKAAQLAWAKEHGFEQLQTRNEQRNEPMRRLNEELGYEPAVGRVYLRGPLSAR
jgi:GNAT superfamily N-acetyltransferase